MLLEILCQLLGHALGQGGDQGALAPGRMLLGLRQQVVDLGAGRAHMHRRVDQARRARDHLHHRARALGLELSRRRRDIHRLRPQGIELLEAQRPVVQRRRQPKAVLHQGLLARAVALEHRPDLRNRYMALVDEQQPVRRQVIEQRRRRLARLPARQVPGVVLDALAGAGRLHLLQVEQSALRQALGLHQPAGRLELGGARRQLALDAAQRAADLAGRQGVVRGGIDREARHLAARRTGKGIEQLQLLDLVVEQPRADRQLRMLRREHVHHVAAHPEGTALEIVLLPPILHRHQALDNRCAPDPLAAAQMQDHRMVIDWIADAEDRRDRRHHQHVAALDQGLGR